jgi:putative sigma-54 modulation protein
MQVSITFRHMEPVEELKEYAAAKLAKIKKYFYNPVEASVILTREKHRNIAEVTLVVNRFTLKGQEETADMYSAIDLVTDKIERQAKKYKDKIRRRKPNHSGTAAGGPTQEEESEEVLPEGEAEADRVEIERCSAKPMSVEEAVLQMDLLKEHDFFMFVNEASGEVNLIRRKRDGGYLLVVPEKD